MQRLSYSALRVTLCKYVYIYLIFQDEVLSFWTKLWKIVTNWTCHQSVMYASILSVFTIVSRALSQCSYARPSRFGWRRSLFWCGWRTLQIGRLLQCQCVCLWDPHPSIKETHQNGSEADRRRIQSTIEFFFILID